MRIGTNRGVGAAYLSWPHSISLTARIQQAQKREYTSIWRARQSADVLGVPYDFLIRETIDALMASGRCRTMPRPNQIAGALTDKAIRNRVKQQWTDWAAFNFDSMISRLPQYMNHAYLGLHAQDAHRDWVLERLGDGHPRNVGCACYIFQTLPEDRAVAHFGEERIAQARDEVRGETPAAMAELEPGQWAPSCFAVPFAFEKNNVICSACPVKRSCETMESFARATLRNACGSEDPEKPREQRTESARPPASAPCGKGCLAIIAMSVAKTPDLAGG